MTLQIGDKVIVYHPGYGGRPQHAVTTLRKVMPSTVEVEDYLFYRSSHRFDAHMVYPYSDVLIGLLSQLAEEFDAEDDRHTRERRRIAHALDVSLKAAR